MANAKQESLLRVLEKIMEEQKKEADAVIGYTELIALADEALSEEQDALEVIKSTVGEILQDELDHQAHLLKLYTTLAGAEPAGEEEEVVAQ